MDTAGGVVWVRVRVRGKGHQPEKGAERGLKPRPQPCRPQPSHKHRGRHSGQMRSIQACVEAYCSTCCAVFYCLQGPGASLVVSIAHCPCEYTAAYTTLPVASATTDTEDILPRVTTVSFIPWTNRALALMSACTLQPLAVCLFCRCLWPVCCVCGSHTYLIQGTYRLSVRKVRPKHTYMHAQSHTHIPAPTDLLADCPWRVCVS